jgi:hypothetical protein
MIKYALACENDHAFESWFPSSDAFEAQAKRGLVSCPMCDSTKVEKQIMAPRVSRTDKGARHPEPIPEAKPNSEAQPVAILSEQEQQLRAMLKAVREHVLQNAENVGKGFAEEARKMHYGEVEHRSIYGEATPGEARELLEEGIEVHPLPIVPSDRN